MLRTRVLTALVLLALLLAAALYSPLALVGLCAAFLGLMLSEWLRLSGWRALPAGGAGGAVAVAAFGLEAGGWHLGAAALGALCAAALLGWVAIGALLVRMQLRGGVTLPGGALALAAALLCGAAWFALLELLRTGEVWTLSVLALVWLADIAAYFFGRLFGRAKLAPRISPGKTWAGVWGAFGMVLGVTLLLRWLWPEAGLWPTRLLRAATLPALAALAALVALSIVGDLFESLVKRQAGVKDSGRVFPGHGGAWDRLDACLPALPLAVLAQGLLLPAAPAGLALAGGCVPGLAPGPAQWDAHLCANLCAHLSTYLSTHLNTHLNNVWPVLAQALRG
jgi:phosphatidate cytidylyltransferase